MKTLRKILNKIAAEIRHTREVYSNHTRMIELEAHFDATDVTAARAMLAEWLAFRLGVQAKSLEASWLARAVTFLPAPEQVREMAAEWAARAVELRQAGRPR